MCISREKFEVLERRYDTLARQYFHVTEMTLRNRDEWRELIKLFPNTNKDALLTLLDDGLFAFAMSRVWLFQDLGIEDSDVSEALFYEAIKDAVPLNDFLMRARK